MFVLFGIALALALVLFVLSTYAGPKDSKNPEHTAPFECGNDSPGARHARLSVKFYLTAILFVVFDIEAMFLYPWAIQFASLGWRGLFSMVSFLAVLIIGLIYAWKKGALEWEK
jgi:NADH-quinone oxidoreductase subunit A